MASKTDTTPAADPAPAEEPLTGPASAVPPAPVQFVTDGHRFGFVTRVDEFAQTWVSWLDEATPAALELKPVQG